MPRMGWQLCRGISGSFRLESVAALLWNQWQLSCGTGGSFAVESVAGFTWNRWQLWRGIRSPLPKNGYFAVKSMQNKHEQMVATTSPDWGNVGPYAIPDHVPSVVGLLLQLLRHSTARAIM